MVGKKRTEYVVRFAGDFKERSAKLDTFDVPRSLFEYADAVPGPQLISLDMAGLYMHLMSLERRKQKFSIDQFRTMGGRYSRKRMVAIFKHMEALELIECLNLEGAKPDTPLEFNVLEPYDAEALEENRLRLWERVKESPAFRKRRAARPTTRLAGVH